MKNYYSILGVSETSSVDDIKRAYRRKVSTVHPDVNPSPNANDEFIELNEAYECLLKLKTGFSYNNTTNQYSKSKNSSSDSSFVDEVRARARENAKKEYEEFVNTSFYKTHIAMVSIFDYLLLGVLIAFFGLFILYISVYLKTSGIIIGLLLATLLSTFLYRAYSNMYHPPISDIKIATKMVFSHDVFHLVILTIINLIAFFQYGFATFLPFKLIVSLYLIVPLIFQFGLNFIKSQIALDSFLLLTFLKGKKAIIWGVFPFLFSIFLSTNYHFSTNDRTETYFFHPDYESDGSFCVLENDKYEKYGGIRYIFLDSKFSESRYVTYSIAKGFWGVDVLKKYHLSTTKTD